jgi:hypothetical protein
MDKHLQNWIPYKITDTANEPLCHWLNSYNKPFTEPFFDETITACKALRNKPLNSTSSLAVFDEWCADVEYVKPTAFIFHISRCGSTLVSQLLGTDEQNICLAEVPFFDDALRLHFKNPRYNTDKAGHLFTTALKFYAKKRNGTEKRLFVKTDSWHIFFYEQIRKLFPDVPFILLYRNPAEVLNSHSKQRGMQAVPGLIEPELLGFEPAEAFNTNLDEYTAKVLARYLTRYLEISQKGDNTLLLNYNQGPMAMIQSIAGFTNTPISQNIILKMQKRSEYHSKRPGQAFAEEQTKQVPALLSGAMQLYEKLNATNLPK